MKQLLMASILSSLLFVPQQVGPIAPDPWVPVGDLPWDVPQLPIVSIDLGLPAATFDTVEHTEDYEDNLDALEGQQNTQDSLDEATNTAIGDWFGPDGILPDLSGDFDPGIDVPGYEGYSAEDIAEAMGADVADMLSGVRGLAGIDIHINSLTVSLAFMILCLCWMLFILILKFGINVVDMLISLVVKVIELIPGE